MISIGEFSKATSLTVKTLRYYHELGILAPEKIDSESGYRFYNQSSFEQAEKIRLLKEHGFTLGEIKDILQACRSDDDLGDFIHKKMDEIRCKIKEYKALEERLRLLSASTEHHLAHNGDIEEIDLEESMIASVRFKGKYTDIGEKFRYLFKKAGRYSKGSPFALFYDGEYREDNADIQAGIFLNRPVTLPGINTDILKGGKAVCTLHKGPYGNQGPCYLKLFEYCRRNAYDILYPLQEVYLKGPGLIFPRNPKHFVTRICIRVG